MIRFWRRFCLTGACLRHVLAVCLLVALVSLFAIAPPVRAQDEPPVTATPTADEAPPDTPERVDVQPVARDEEIGARLLGILEATGWFIAPEVRVEEGVVFLNGRTETEDFKTWAGDLASRTQDVAAVVNRIEVIEPSVWDFQPALAGLREQGRALVRAMPLIGFSLGVLLITVFVARFIVSATRKSLQRRDINQLLRNVIARVVGVIVFLIGLYIVFQIAGLTNVALTVLGGTGLLGLVLGIAFQDITENFLAGILLSVQNPFRAGDQVQIADIIGFVQMLTTRTTVLMTLDGNHVQIPNATVYKSTIHNFTSNPNRRQDFVVGIGYDDSLSAAQEVALQVLRDHPAVLAEPEPNVLVESLGSATVNLHIFFWLDGHQYSWQKVRSSVIRLIKIAFQNNGISMPDEARELIFPQGVPVLLQRDDEAQAPATGRRPQEVRVPQEAEAISTDAEGGLRSEAGEIEAQAQLSRSPEEGENLLKPSVS